VGSLNAYSDVSDPSAEIYVKTVFLTEGKNSLEDWKAAIKDGYFSFGYCENDKQE
jgi:hypothetical protein